MLKIILLIPIYVIRRWGTFLLIPGVFILLILLVHRSIYHHFLHHPRYQVNPDILQIVERPDWLTNKRMEQTIQASIKGELTSSIFDKDLIPKVLAHYQKNPWVEKVELIEKRLPNDLRVRLKLRKPVAAVLRERWDHRQIYYLVDKHTVRLPGQYRSIPELATPLPIIVGIKNLPPDPGHKWPDKGLQSAVAVAEILDKYKIYAELDIARIDVTNTNSHPDPRHSEIIIWTRNKVPIQWGRPPQTENYGELPVEEKIKNLKLVLEICPQLKGVKYVKIQFHQPYISLKK